MSSAGGEAAELAASCGLVLDPWQRLALDDILAERADGKWAAFEAALVVPRQNGKGSVLEALSLAGLFLLGEGLILHSAHEFKTAAEAFRRVLSLVNANDDLVRLVSKVRTSHGEEGIELRSGQRLRFVARSSGSGRGFTGDRVILDEAYNLDGKAMAALMPTLSARPNPQIVYTSSAGMAESQQLRAVRERGVAGGSSRLCYLEWSAEDDADLDDPRAWADANPGVGYRIDLDFVAAEREAMPDAEFARERLGIWEPTGGAAVVDVARWAALADRGSSPSDPVAFAVDVNWERSFAAVAVAGGRADGSRHVEVVEHRAGTAWVADRLVELVGRWSPCAVVLDAAGPAGSLLPVLEAAGVPIAGVSVRESAQACGAFYDDVLEGTVRHLGQPALDAAVAGARKRTMGDAWAWARRDPTVDISPLVAATLALHAHRVNGRSGDPGMFFL